ncbi:DUF6221 family protein [Streptomycetaceae bacterium NBC_01309]
MAEPGPPIDAIIDGVPRRVELICFVRTSHGLMARVCWREVIAGEPTPVTAPVPERARVDQRHRRRDVDMTDDLVAFLRARLKDDEDGALLAAPWPWHLNAEADEVIAVDDIQVAEVFALSNNQLRNTAAHIARHDPQRVLAEVAAKRAMIDAYEKSRGQDTWGDPQLSGWLEGKADGLLIALQVLATAHADHPDYREEWKP